MCFKSQHRVEEKEAEHYTWEKIISAQKFAFDFQNYDNILWILSLVSQKLAY